MLTANCQQLLLLHNRFHNAVYGIENAFVGYVEIVGENGKCDLLAANRGRIAGERLDSAERASLGVDVRPRIKIREAIRQGTVDSGNWQRSPKAGTPRLACGIA
jgi:hypothetical protein